jgi:hypothetical protein
MQRVFGAPPSVFAGADPKARFRTQFELVAQELEPFVGSRADGAGPEGKGGASNPGGIGG